MGEYFIPIIVVLIIMGLLFILIPYLFKRYKKNKVNQLHIGMTEKQLISIMGKRYTRSFLQGNIIQYEWLLHKANSVGINYSDTISSRSYSLSQHLLVLCKDSQVIEIRTIQ